MKPFGPLQLAWRLVVGWLVVATVSVGFLVAALILLPARRLRLGVANRYANVVGAIGLWLCGVRTTGHDRHRMQAVGPAIYVMNHCSTLDAFLTFWVCPPYTSGIGKKELLWIPFFGQAWWLSGSLLVDRGRLGKAIAQMNRVAESVERLRISVFMSPEGTRSDDGRLQPFKKGFAHLALATRLPVVPVVMRGAHHRWPNGTWRLTPGVVDIEVLDPIPTTDWRAEDLDKHVADVHARFVAALPEDQRPEA